MEDKLEMMSELVGDGCNTVNPATYCDISNVGADKVGSHQFHSNSVVTMVTFLGAHSSPDT